MKEKSKSIFKRVITSLMVIVTLCSTLFATSMPVHASSLSLDEKTSYQYTGVSPNTGYAVNHTIYVLKMDGKKVFCVESGIPANSGEGYVPESYVNAKKETLAKIAYYGYTNTNQTHYDYAVTQVMIWEELGDQYQSSTIPNYQARKAEIMALVNKHDTLPSWHGQEVSVKVGESITLTDSNGVLTDMTLESNTTNADLNQSGNKITITPSDSSNNGTITYRKVPKNEVGTSIIYRKPNQQSMVEFHLESSKQASVKVNVIKLGNIQACKIDEETGKPLPNAKLKFEYDGTSKEIVTDSNGLATIKNFTAIDTHTIHEKEVIEKQIVDTNSIESFVESFAIEYFSWQQSQGAIDKRNEQLKNYLTEDLQQLNVDMVRTDIPTTAIIRALQIWNVSCVDDNTFDVLFSVEQQIAEGENKKNVVSTYTVTVHVDKAGDMVIIKNPTMSSKPQKSDYQPKMVESDGTVDAVMTEEINSFLETFFKLYPSATEKELAYYVSNNSLPAIHKDYVFAELVNPVYVMDDNQVKVTVTVKYLDQEMKVTQLSQFELMLQKQDNWKIVD